MDDRTRPCLYRGCCSASLEHFSFILIFIPIIIIIVSFHIHHQDYKPPTCKDIPMDWRISLLPDSPCPQGVRGSKGMWSVLHGLHISLVSASCRGSQAWRRGFTLPVTRHLGASVESHVLFIRVLTLSMSRYN